MNLFKREMNLFERKTFTMHSGDKSDFKIECDALTNEDIETLALLVSKKYDFNLVIGIPTGGEAFAEKLIKYKNPKSSTVLVVDDVLTTGASMEEYHYNIEGKENIGVVIFARGECPAWVTPIFKMWSV